MKYVFVLILVIFLAGCTVQFKGKDLDLDIKPAEPGIKMSNRTYELQSISFLKEGS